MRKTLPLKVMNSRGSLKVSRTAVPTVVPSVTWSVGPYWSGLAENSSRSSGATTPAGTTKKRDGFEETPPV